MSPDTSQNATHAEHGAHESPAPVASPPPQPVKGVNLFKKLNLQRTSNAFVAEYSVMLVALTFTVSNLVWLIFLLAGLITSVAQGVSAFSFLEVHMLVLWIAVLSAVTIPVTGVLWSRVQGELANNPDYKGELPKGGARGFRTFWLVITGLSMLLMFATAIYGPIGAALNGDDIGLSLVGMTLPSLLSVGVLGVATFMLTRGTERRKLVRVLLWALALLTFVLVAVDYTWAANTSKVKDDPYDRVPTSPIVPAPEDYYNDYEYDNDYNSDYYDSYPY